MKFDLETGSWEYEPPSTCYLGGSFGSQSSSGFNNSFSWPTNLQNGAFINNQANTANVLQDIGYGNGAGLQYSGGLYGISPFMADQVPTWQTDNPLVAPVTGAQQSTLGQIGTLLGQTPGNLQSGYSLLQAEASPTFAQSLATSPATQAAEQAAISPITNQFNTQTVPGLQGSFTQAGQRVGSTSGMGSSAFDNAFASAQGNELATEAATTGAIANNAYQTGLNITANAPAQMGNLNATEMNTLISGLNAQALPQLTEQLGISAGTQLYNQQINTIMQALGLQVQGEQPVIGYNSQSQGQSSGSGASAGASFGQVVR